MNKKDTFGHLLHFLIHPKPFLSYADMISENEDCSGQAYFCNTLLSCHKSNFIGCISIIIVMMSKVVIL